MAFRIGRKHAYHTYPEPRGGASVSDSFANNVAVGPSETTAIPIAGIELPWAIIGSGAPAGPDIPITIVAPASSALLIWGVVSLKNGSDVNDVDVTLAIRIDGVALGVPLDSKQTVVTDGAAVMAFHVETPIPAGSYEVQILLSANFDNDVTITTMSSSIKIEQTTLPTG